jgi:hypothetical protein
MQAIRRASFSEQEGLMLTTEALVADIREDDKKAAGAGGHGGGPGGGMGGMY